MIELPEDLKASEVVSTGKDKFAIFVRTEAQADEIIRRCKAHEGLAEALNNLSKWAAAIHWNRKKNTQDWMDGLKDRIEIAEQALANAGETK